MMQSTKLPLLLRLARPAALFQMYEYTIAMELVISVPPLREIILSVEQL